jgi:hypothetical protein
VQCREHSGENTNLKNQKHFKHIAKIAIIFKEANKMVEKLLIYTDDEELGVISFPKDGTQAALSSYTFTEGRMGSVNISSSLMYPKCLDDEWTQREFVEFRGERYWILDTPTSSKSNTDLRYKHELVFKSDRTKLDNTYFFDVVSPDAGDVDQFVSNSTKFTFFGDIAEFATRLNYSLQYSGVGYSVVIDEGISSEAKLMSFEDKYFSEVLQEVFNVYELPYYFVGKVIHIGFTNNAITHTFKYGYDRELLTITKTNANYKIVNRCTGIGSTENIPYYYPNDTRKTEVGVEADPNNVSIKQEDITIVNEDKFKKNVSINEEISYNEVDYTDAAALAYNAFSFGLFMDQGYINPYTEKNRVYLSVTKTDSAGERYWDGYMYLRLSVKKAGKYWFSYSCLQTREHKNPDAEKPYTWRPTDVIINFQEYGGADVPFSYRGTYELDLGELEVKEYLLTFQFHYRRKEYIDYTNVYFTFYDTHWRYFGKNWNHRGEVIPLDRIGISITKQPTVGDKFKQIKIEKDYMITSPNLLPSIYRETFGAERFYDAKNQTYINPDTGSYYDFENPYTEGNPKEMIVSFDYIKPTIKGIENAAGYKIGEILDVAFDDDDNDEIDPNTNEYEHKYFYIKLRKFDGDYGFNLFDQAIVGSDMTISMTSGNCAACNFVISVLEVEDKDNNITIFKNPVQVDSSGNIVTGSEDDKWKEANIQPQQQDTTTNEVWIRVSKDDDTFGVVMPSNNRNYKPKSGDSFVLLHIDLPKQYILNAENELKEAIIKYMAANNSEKFNFSINFKRIFFAEYPEMLSQIDANARLQIEYNNKLHELYISQYTYKVNETDPLPEITVELSDTITIRKGNVQKSIDAVKQDIMSSIGSIDFLKMGLKYFIRKDVDDSANGHIIFKDGIYVTGNNEEGTTDFLYEGGIDNIQEGNGDFIQEDSGIIKAVETPQTLGSLYNVNPIVDEIATEDVVLVKKVGSTEWTQERKSMTEGITDAPSNDILYGRKNKEWIKVPDTPTKLPNPNALTFTGAIQAIYDGSAPITVNIPTGGGGSITIDDHLDLNSTNAVQNKVVTMNINELMDEVFKISFDTFVGGGTFEKGSVVTPYIFWSILYKDEEVVPTTATVNGSTEGVNEEKSKYSSPTTITTDKNYKVICTYGSQSIEKTANYIFSLKKYWGASSVTELTNSDVMLMDNGWASRTMGKTTFDCTGGKYIYYIIPFDIYGEGVSFWINGFKNTDVIVYDMEITNGKNVTETYKVMRLNNIQTGILEVEFK